MDKIGKLLKEVKGIIGNSFDIGDFGEDFGVDVLPIKNSLELNEINYEKLQKLFNKNINVETENLQMMCNYENRQFDIWSDEDTCEIITVAYKENKTTFNKKDIDDLKSFFDNFLKEYNLIYLENTSIERPKNIESLVYISSRQAITRRDLWAYKGNKFEFVVNVDTVEHQSYAKACMFDKNSLEWKTIYAIPYSEMKTNKGLIYKSCYEKNPKFAKTEFNKDIATLQTMALKILY